MNVRQSGAENNLKSGFRRPQSIHLIRVFLHVKQKKKKLERLPKAILKDILGSVTENMTESFVEDIPKRRDTKRHKMLSFLLRRSFWATNVKQSPEIVYLQSLEE